VSKITMKNAEMKKKRK